MRQQFRSLSSMARKLKKDLKGVHARRRTATRKGTPKVNGNDFVLVFAHNSVGKTRLSMEFKNLGKKNGGRDTLYFNAFTEDLFDWDNDFPGDTERKIKFKSSSHFFDGLEGSGIEDLIRPHLFKHTDFDFRIDYIDSEIRFHRDVIESGTNVRKDDIKISRGEENLFVWCFFLAILELALEAKKGERYDWVKYVYIDDPISSLDEHNTIALASDLGQMLKAASNQVKVVISTHHGLFFNMMFNELTGKRNPGAGSKNINKKSYILSRSYDSLTWHLSDTGETPFLHHVIAVSELRAAANSGEISQYHCNILRSVLEKTSVFFGRSYFSTCYDGLPEKALYTRFINARSHAKYSVFEPQALSPEEKRIFRRALEAFLIKYPFFIAAR